VAIGAAECAILLSLRIVAAARIEVGTGAPEIPSHLYLTVSKDARPSNILCIYLYMLMSRMKCMKRRRNFVCWNFVCNFVVVRCARSHSLSLSFCPLRTIARHSKEKIAPVLEFPSPPPLPRRFLCCFWLHVLLLLLCCCLFVSLSSFSEPWGGLCQFSSLCFSKLPQNP